MRSAAGPFCRLSHCLGTVKTARRPKPETPDASQAAIHSSPPISLGPLTIEQQVFIVTSTGPHTPILAGAVVVVSRVADSPRRVWARAMTGYGTPAGATPNKSGHLCVSRSMTSTIGAVMSNETPSPDSALLTSVRDGDRKAREALGQRVGNSAYLFALQLTGGSEAARDIAQDSVLLFFQYLDRFDAGQPVEPWLYQIVRNRVRDLSRRDRLRRHESLESWLEHGRLEAADPTADPVADAERHDLQQRVWRAISELAEPHREIIVLRDYHDLSYREIAKVLSIPQGTVMSRLHAARKRLREVIVSAGESFPDQPSTGRGDR